MRERKRKLIKITEAVRTAALRRPLIPNIVWDADHPGFALYVTCTRGFWGWNYTPHGLNPETVNAGVRGASSSAAPWL